MGNFFYIILVSTFIFSSTFVQAGEIEEDFVIIEKPDLDIEYQITNTDDNQGSPVVKSRGKYWGFSSLKKEFTNISEDSENIPSSFIGLIYGYSFNWKHFTIAGDVGFYYGSRSSDLAGEESSEALQSSLKNQVLTDVGLNLVLNSFEKYYLRPYVGGGGYYNRYKYLDSESSNGTKFYGISSSFIRAGILIDIGRIDSNSGMNLWKEFGVYRASLMLEMKKYSPVDPSLNTSKAELNTSLVFEY